MQGAHETGTAEIPRVTPRASTRAGLWLVVATMAYNVIEAVVALWSGARADSIALIGFGLDSVIELAAATVLLWRLTVEARGADSEAIERTERRVHVFVGITFLLLAVYVTSQAVWILWTQEAPGESVIGIVLAVASLVIMPFVSWGKLHAARQIGSAALRAEAKETLACAYLSFTLLLGLAANATAGWWWADPVAALLMVPWLVKEGREGAQRRESRRRLSRTQDFGVAARHAGARRTRLISPQGGIPFTQAATTGWGWIFSEVPARP